MISKSIKKSYNQEFIQRRYLGLIRRKLAFNGQLQLKTWRRLLSAKLHELIGFMPDAPKSRLIKEYEKKRVGFDEIRFVFLSETDVYVPAHLLLPKKFSKALPLMICLQGHTSGMHISLGRERYPGDRKWLENGDRDFAVQAVRAGYAALAIEQRCFGERAVKRPRAVVKFSHPCRHAALVSLLAGRTMIGERIFDIRRAIDYLREFPQIDRRRIAVMGHSGGGMSAYFSACLDARIKAAMVSGYVCQFEQSIAAIDHCEDNYIPGFLKYFDLEDLAGLIVPRPLLIVTGKKDIIFPIKGARAAFKKIEKIYSAFAAADRLKLVVGNGGHRFYAQEAWPEFKRLSGWSMD